MTGGAGVDRGLPREGVAGKLLLAAAVVAFFALWSVAYTLLNAWGSQPGRGAVFPAPTQSFPWLFQPWTAVIYVFGGYATVLLPFLWGFTRRRVRLILTAYTVTSLVSFAVYAAWPVVMVRPDYAGDGLGLALMRAVIGVDDPANCFPSSHTYFAILCPLLVGCGPAPRWAKIGAWVLGVAVALTTVTVGQHYFMDVAGGAVVAVLGYTAARRLAPAA